MKIEKTKIPDLLVLLPKIFFDDRGYFYESYNKNSFKEATGLDIDFVQDNESKSSKGVIRGLHYQLPPYPQSKLIRVIQGEILDVVVDIRENSRTYGEVFSIILNEENKKMLFVPRGFAHGFSVLSEKAIINYKCDNFYNKNSESGIIYNDKNLNIDWKVESAIISEKDKVHPQFGDHIKYISV